MKKMTKVLSALLVIAMVFSMVACTQPGTGTTGATNPSAGPDTPGSNNTTTYTVNVKTVGGMPMADLGVYIYVGSDKGDVKMNGSTDANGQAVFNLPENAEYVVVLDGVPNGYAKEAYYPFSGKTCDITLTSSLIQGEDITGGHLFQVGDVMYDFSVTTPEGETLTLSEVLAENRMVMLNFWYSTCSWCVTEFPVLQAGYEEYGDLFEIIALDPYPTDTPDDVRYMREAHGLTFPMAQCPMEFEVSCFGSTGYPTSVFIDRYGVICMIEIGAIVSQHAFTTVVKHFTADDYQQELIYSMDQIVEKIRPEDVLDPEDWLEGDAMAEIMGSTGNENIGYHHEEDEEDAEYSWPFISAEYNGETVLKSSNAFIDSSYAMLYIDVTLKAGEAFGFDYICSTDSGWDLVYVIVDGNDVYAISGDTTADGWKGCYPWVATQDGTYEVAICYMKDGSDNYGEDTFYIKNARIIDAAEIDTPSYIPRQAAEKQADGSFKYADIVYNEADGYYHVGNAEGPLLLANLMGYTQFRPNNYIWDLFYTGTVRVDDATIEKMETFSNYALNSMLYGYCTVNKELAEILQIVDDQLGFFDEDKMEWLKICEYYDAYGTEGAQLVDPVEGLAPFSALNAQEGTGWFNAETGEMSDYNCFYFDGRPIMPRGKFAEFIPEKSGVYMITSADSTSMLFDGWIFNSNREEIYYASGDIVGVQSNSMVTMLFYMEAGTPYYINMGPNDIYEVCYISFNIEFVAETMDVLKVCSPVPFTFDLEILEQTGAYVTVPGGIKAVLNPDDNKYYQDLGKDADGNQIYGSPIYVTFTQDTGILGRPIYSPYGSDVISVGGFNFGYTENDQLILAFLAMYEGDKEATLQALREYWGDAYEENYELYRVDMVLAGGVNGTGIDYSDFIRGYIDQMITEGELYGCFHVTKELAEVLQMLMDKYTFAGVEYSWLKLCFYYDHLGPRN